MHDPAVDIRSPPGAYERTVIVHLRVADLGSIGLCLRRAVASGTVRPPDQRNRPQHLRRDVAVGPDRRPVVEIGPENGKRIWISSFGASVCSGISGTPPGISPCCGNGGPFGAQPASRNRRTATKGLIAANLPEPPAREKRGHYGKMAQVRTEEPPR